MENEYLHEVIITAIIVKDGKYLIQQRSKDKKRFPGMWSVPGGHLEVDDYSHMEKETEHYWYNVLEKALKRECLEECGLEIENVVYVTSLATIHKDGYPSIVISCMADYKGGEVQLQEGETVDSAWVTTKEAKDYELLDGIYEELVMADKLRKGERVEWDRYE